MAQISVAMIMMEGMCDSCWFIASAREVLPSLFASRITQKLSTNFDEDFGRVECVKVKVKCAILLLEFRWDAHLPS